MRGILCFLALLASQGAAFAVGATIETGLKYRDAISVRVPVDGGSMLYKVPKNRRFIVSDLIVTNADTHNQLFEFFAGAAKNCKIHKDPKLSVMVTAESTLHIPMQTGIVFPGGSFICAAGIPSYWTMNGVLVDP